MQAFKKYLMAIIFCLYIQEVLKYFHIVTYIIIINFAGNPNRSLILEDGHRRGGPKITS